VLSIRCSGVLVVAISFVSSASATSDTVAMPSHQAGDMIVFYAHNKTNTTAIGNPAGTKGYVVTMSSASSLVGYKVATSSSETVGIWTNATSITVAVYRIDSPESWMAPILRSDTNTGASMTFAEGSHYGSYFFPQERNTKAWMLRFASHTTATNVGANVPTGWTSRTSTGATMCMDSNGIVPENTAVNVGDNTISVNASGVWSLVTVQLRVWDGKGAVCVYAVSRNTASTYSGIDTKSGDLVVGFAARSDGNTPPTLPSGYTSFHAAGADSLATLLCFRVVGDSAAMPAFTDATSSSIMVYRAAKGSFSYLTMYPKNGVSTAVDWVGSGVTPLEDTDSKYIRFGAFRGTGTPTLPSGWPTKAIRPSAVPTNFASDADPVVDVDNIGENVMNLSINVAWRTYTVQVISELNAKEENTNVASQPVPSGYIGCYVSLIGGGGSGGGAATRGGTGSGNGGGGGGGGGYVGRVFVPMGQLGATYSVAAGVGGAGVGTSVVGNSGGNSVFSSGSITVTAYGGAGGQTATTPTGGAGGTVSVPSGLTYDVVDSGAVGGDGSTAGSTAGSPGGNSTTNAGAGGGGGGANRSTVSIGGKGGDSTTVLGGTGGSVGGAGGTPAASTLGFGGAGGGGGGANTGFGANAGPGGTGAIAGGGGGGGGGKEGFLGNAGGGGAGADGYTLIEWVKERPPNPGHFFQSYDGF